MTTGVDRTPCCASVASALATDVSWFRVTCAVRGNKRER